MRGQIISRLFHSGSVPVVLSVLVGLTIVPVVWASAQRQSTRSPHGPLNIPCENCHTATSWTPIRAIPEFNHDSTRYPLRGMHEKVSCTGCHVKPVFTDVGKNCADCHADIHRRQMGSNCAQCHTVNGWNVSVQAINNHFNRFPLLGAHAVVECEQCHKGAAVGNFLGLSTACESCHIRDFQNTTNPNHVQSGFSTKCEECHKSFDSWLNATFTTGGGTFDHASTGFPLTQGHANVACELCHIGGNYNLHIQLNDCGNSQCHLNTWRQTNNPTHAAAPNSFPIAQCSTCHTPAGWTTATFDHSTTGFPLTLGHANVACSSCHLNNNYNLKIAATDCGNSQCHLTTYNQTNNPPHAANPNSFPIANCSNCHTTAGWTAAFDHSTTGFTLIGTHMSPSPTPCASCHNGPNPYSLTSADCYSSNCHLSAYQGTTNPNHAAAGFPTATAQCAACHPITTWSAATFNHSAFGFDLTNGHANVACSLCHINNNYSLQIAATDCGNSQCHLTTYNQTNAPPHAANPNSFPIAQCSTCHTTVSWTASFDHSTTGFALTGLHISPVPTPCASCHINNNYNLTSAACINCHLKEWNSTTTLGGSVPNHITAGFPQDCSMCHSTSNWTTSTFNHNTTKFPLTGAHTAVLCATCHTDNYAGTLATTCDGCHDALYVSTATMGGTVPNHVALTYPKTCDSCHTTTTWLGAVFNHASTGFPLTGAHATTACSLCHTSSAVPPTACSGCHMDKWLSTVNLGGQVPNHVAAALISSSGFSLAACSTCHNTTAWTGAVFPHSWFNINHGNNAAGGVCSVCHIVSGDYSQFQCTVCHGNNNAANFHHPNVGGYAYNSAACYQCHSRG